MRLQHLRTTTATVVLGIALCWRGIARAEDPNAILDLLEHKGLITHEEAAEARRYYDKQQAEAVTKYDKTKVAGWIDQMKWSGDVRLRFDDTFPERSLNQADRLRWRVRLRLGAELKLQDWADIGFRLASGETSPGNPNSANVTFTGLFSKKPVNIDLAYATIHPPGWDWVRLSGGKINVPTWAPSFNSPMIYDPDLTVEGAGEQFGWHFGNKPQFKVFANAGQYVLSEFSGDSNDSYMFDQQVGIQAKLDPLTATLAGGYYLTRNLQNVTVAQTPTSGNTGNSVAGANFLADFNTWYGAGELVWQFFENPFLGTPAVLKFSGQYQKNVRGVYENDPLGNDTQDWTGQVGFGDAAKKGQWMIAYQYKRLEANSTLDAIVDDDFGAGGTDRKGHVIKAAYNVFDWWQLGFTSFITQKIDAGRTGSHSQPGAVGEHRLRIFADSMFKF